ncbi:MAG: HlyC/CorC family transporter [Clostridiaceae bacterium]|nr:HlyC/CorC family transporter [Clostridiaceae bacterium]
MLILLLLLVFSAFFSTSETALMALSKIRVRHMMEKKSKGAELIYKHIREPNKLLGTILVGNNIVNIAASALATSLALKFYPVNGVIIATAVMTILVLVFAEITPKSLAARNAEKVSLIVIKPIALIVVLLYPIVIIFTFITNKLMNIVGGGSNKNKPSITEDELRTVVTVSQEEGVLEKEEKDMIYNVFEFGDQRIKDVMIQRRDMVAINVISTYEGFLNIVRDEKYSRYPIYEEGIDNIVGILNVKDLLFIDHIEENFNIKRYIRKPYYTFEYKKTTELFKEMKKNKIHIAIVLDEYGGTAGIVTLEDLIEEIVGDIQDEYDEYEKDIELVKENEYIVKGSTKLNDINDVMKLNLESEDFDSIGGFITGRLGRLPKSGEVIIYNNIKMVVENVEGNRIQRLRMFT